MVHLLSHLFESLNFVVFNEAASFIIQISELTHPATCLLGKASSLLLRNYFFVFVSRRVQKDIKLITIPRSICRSWPVILLKVAISLLKYSTSVFFIYLYFPSNDERIDLFYGFWKERKFYFPPSHKWMNYYSKFHLLSCFNCIRN